MWLARGGRDAENTYTAEIIPQHHQSAPTPNYLFLGGEWGVGEGVGGLWLSGFLLVLWSGTSAADHTFDTKGTSEYLVGVSSIGQLHLSLFTWRKRPDDIIIALHNHFQIIPLN